MILAKKVFLTLLCCTILLFKISAQENKNYIVDVRINFWKSISGKLESITDSNLVVIRDGKSVQISINEIKMIKAYTYQRQALLNTVVLLATIGNIVYSITVDDPLTAIAVGVVGTSVIVTAGFFIHKVLNPAVFAIHARKEPLSSQILKEKLSPYITPF